MLDFASAAYLTTGLAKVEEYSEESDSYGTLRERTDEEE
jgi:hypothetical protein